MNVSKAIELAFASVVRKFANVGESTVVRCWQSLDAENGGWTKEKDRAFPMVDVRCSTPYFDDNERTMYCEATVLCGTKADDDLGHSVCSSIYGAIQGAIDALMAQDFAHTDGEELAEFKAVLSSELGASFHFGGFKGFNGAAPYDDGGVNILGCGFRVDYSRADISV